MSSRRRFSLFGAVVFQNEKGASAPPGKRRSQHARQVSDRGMVDLLARELAGAADAGPLPSFDLPFFHGENLLLVVTT